MFTATAGFEIPSGLIKHTWQRFGGLQPHKNKNLY